MKYYSGESGGRVIIIRLNRGDLLRESIEQVIADAGITDGTLVCGYGALSSCTLHMVKTHDVFPALEEYPRWEDTPLELVSMIGIIADRVPHIHAVVSDTDRAIGGHLEPGCVVAYLTEIVIYEHKNICLTRKPTDWGPLALEEKN